MKEAFREHTLLVFPGQAGPTAEKWNTFAERLLGRLDDTMPEITFTNVRKNGSLLQEDSMNYRMNHTAEGWHTDHTFLPVSLKAALLYAEQVPLAGGETEFCDMRAGFNFFRSFKIVNPFLYWCR